MSVMPLPPLVRLPDGLDAQLHEWQGYWRRRNQNAKLLFAEAQSCLAICEAMRDLDQIGLQQQLQIVRDALRLDPNHARGQLIVALATVGQVAYRTVGKQPYAVQFMAALALHRGWLAEMATGEGKTLTVSLAGVLAGWAGRPCHILTANDYLAVRDAEEMSALYQGCGVSLASIAGEHEPQQRTQAYQADVVYTTAKELLADYLRDQLSARSGGGAELVSFQRWLGQSMEQSASAVLNSRGLHTVIIDEADSVLIDEAVTPLILAAPRERAGLADAIVWARDFARYLKEGEDFTVMYRTRSIVLHSSARQLMQAAASLLHPLWQPLARQEELLRNALTVRYFFKVGHQYLVHDGEIVLLDEFTGRMTPGRTLTGGLHQAIEAHENLVLTQPNESMVQLSFQGFFRRFRRLSGITGTANEAARELWRIYKLAVLPIPTHRPRLTIEQPMQVVGTMEQKWQAVLLEIQRVHATGRPVLVGVRSVQASRLLSEILNQHSLDHNVLNAEHHAEEAKLVALAGEPGRIMIATNMAGRGTDIQLPSQAKQLGGLHVVIAECNESARIDRQLAGRCGRQGDPGSVVHFLSLEDSLLQRYGAVLLLKLLGFALCNQSLNIIKGPVANFLLQLVQQRAESDAFSRRWSVLQSDDWMESALPFQQD